MTPRSHPTSPCSQEVAAHSCSRSLADIQGFDTRASRVACLVLAVFFMLTLVWARKSMIAWVTILFTAGLIVLCWLVGSSVALRFLVLFIGVMSCLYSVVSILKIFPTFQPGREKVRWSNNLAQFAPLASLTRAVGRHRRHVEAQSERF